MPLVLYSQATGFSSSPPWREPGSGGPGSPDLMDMIYLVAMDLPAESYLIQQAGQLASRLERISADSTWAHQASGVRVSLLRCLDWIETGRGAHWKRMSELQRLMREGYRILENAAREIKEPR